MKKAPITLFSLFALLFWVKSASAQAVPESCVVTEKATDKSDTLRPGTELRVKATKVNGSSAFFKQPLVFWHGDTLALGSSRSRPQVFLPVESIQFVKWYLPEKPSTRHKRTAAIVAMTAGSVLMATGIVVGFNDNFFSSDPSNPRGTAIALIGIGTNLTGIATLVSAKRKWRTANNPSKDWLVSPLGRGDEHAF